jgi:hypothetical protein
MEISLTFPTKHATLMKNLIVLNRPLQLVFYASFRIKFFFLEPARFIDSETTGDVEAKEGERVRLICQATG